MRAINMKHDTAKQSLTDKPSAAEACAEYPVQAWAAGDKQHALDWLAQEVAVALVYNGVSHVVMMASPTDLQVFAIGFSLTEGIIDQLEDIYDISVEQHDKGMIVALTVSSRCFMRLKNQRRNLTGRSGCGICGAESLEHVRTELKTLSEQFTLSHQAIEQATASMVSHQPLQALTGSVHGAAWCDVDGNILRLCEDVGRHNALDKLIGALWSSGVFSQPGFLLISSRASYEILQKAAKVGISMVVAVSAPTTLAITIAEEVGVCLVGFSREQRHVAYTHSHRLL